MTAPGFHTRLARPLPGLLSGIGSVLGIGGCYYRGEPTLGRDASDPFGLRADWEAVGRDLSACMSREPADHPFRKAG